MFNWFNAGGVFMWLIVVCLIMVVLLAWRGIGSIRKKSFNRARLDLKSLLVLGFSAIAFGVLGQVLGIYRALGAIIVATDISPAIVLEGFRTASISTIFGTIVFIITLLVWLGMRELLWRDTDQRSV